MEDLNLPAILIKLDRFLLKLGDSLRSLGVLKRFRGKSSRNNVKSGGRFPILPQTTTNFRSKQSFELKRVNFHNLINIQIKSDETNEVKRNNNPVIHHSDFLLFNSRSIVIKALELKDFAVDNNVDFMAITETWLKSDVNNNNTIGEFLSNRIQIFAPT